MQSNVNQLQEEAEAENRAAAIRRLDESAGDYAPAATLETERVSYRTSFKEKLKLGVNLNNILEEIVEMRVKWLALLVLGTAAIAATTTRLVGEKQTPPVAATNANSATVGSQPQSAVTKLQLLKEWRLTDGQRSTAESNGMTRIAGETTQPYRAVWNFYARKCGYKPGTFKNDLGTFSASINGITYDFESAVSSGMRSASFSCTADQYEVLVFLFKPDPEAVTHYTVIVHMRDK